MTKILYLLFLCTSLLFPSSSNEIQQHEQKIQQHLHFLGLHTIIDLCVGTSLNLASTAIDMKTQARETGLIKEVQSEKLQTTIKEVQSVAKHVLVDLKTWLDQLNVASASNAQLAKEHMKQEETTESKDLKQMRQYLDDLIERGSQTPTEDDTELQQLLVTAQLVDNNHPQPTADVHGADLIFKEAWTTKLKRIVVQLPAAISTSIKEWFKNMRTSKKIRDHFLQTQISTTLRRQLLQVVVSTLVATLVPFLHTIIGLNSLNSALLHLHTTKSRCEEYIERLQVTNELTTQDIKWQTCKALATSIETVSGPTGMLARHRALTGACPACPDQFQVAWQTLEDAMVMFVKKSSKKYFHEDNKGAGFSCYQYFDKFIQVTQDNQGGAPLADIDVYDASGGLPVTHFAEDVSLRAQTFMLNDPDAKSTYYQQEKHLLPQQKKGCNRQHKSVGAFTYYSRAAPKTFFVSQSCQKDTHGLNPLTSIGILYTDDEELTTEEMSKEAEHGIHNLRTFKPVFEKEIVLSGLQRLPNIDPTKMDRTPQQSCLTRTKGTFFKYQSRGCLMESRSFGAPIVDINLCHAAFDSNNGHLSFSKVLENSHLDLFGIKKDTKEWYFITPILDNALAKDCPSHSKMRIWSKSDVAPQMCYKKKWKSIALNCPDCIMD